MVSINVEIGALQNHWPPKATDHWQTTNNPPIGPPLTHWPSTTDHRSTNRSSIDLPTTEHRPTDPATIFKPTHQQFLHRPINREPLTHQPPTKQNTRNIFRQFQSFTCNYYILRLLLSTNNFSSLTHHSEYFTV